MPAASSLNERRQLAVLFCDLVDSTPLAERFDPEELAELYAIWQGACSGALEAHDGYISDYHGDNVVAFFGYPAAREDAPHRAIQAAIAILAALQTVNAKLRERFSVSLAVRIGVHSGLVLLSDLGGGFVRDQFALGETLNIAARLQTLARPNEIVVSGAMRALTRGFFAFEEISEYTLKGVTRTVEACRVLSATSAHDRIEAGRERGLTEFVARDSELYLLEGYWRAARQGRGTAALLIGEPGIGKSRLLEALRLRVTGDGGRGIALRCSPYHTATALHPLVETIKHSVRIERDEAPAMGFAKLSQALASVGVADADGQTRLISQLLGLALTGAEAPASPIPARRRLEVFDCLVDWVARSAARWPLLLVVEDTHWADPSLLDLLSTLFDRLAETAIFVVLTMRPEGAQAFADRHEIARLPIGRLADADAAALARRAARGRPLSEADVDRIVARGDGVPLFIEELVANHFELAQLAGGNPSIPMTIENLAAVRLDRRPEARATAQLAATLGRQFTFERIREVSTLDENALRAHLDALVEADLMHRTGFGPERAFRFKHALIRDVAYGSMLRSRRAAYHLAIAEAMEASRPGFEGVATELVAHHLTEAGANDRAIAKWREAGQKALARSANAEALLHLDRALKLLGSLEPGPARDRSELSTHLERGAASLMASGQSSPETEASFARARALSESLGLTTEMFSAMFGLCRTQISRGDLGQAQASAGQLLAMAEAIGEPEPRIAALTTLSLVSFHRANLDEADRYAREGLARWEALTIEARQSRLFAIGQHPSVACAFCIAFVACLRADMTTAREFQARATANAHATGIAFQIAQSEFWRMTIAVLARDDAETLARADALLALTHEYPVPHLQVTSDLHRAYLLAAAGKAEEGRELARAARRGVEANNIHVFFLRSIATVAQACLSPEYAAEGLAAILEGYRSEELYGELWWKPELRRIEGELRSLDPSHASDEVEHLFREALAMANAMRLPLFALRASVSLAQRLQARGESAEARAILTAAVDGLSPDLDIRDFQEAAGILQNIGG